MSLKLLNRIYIDTAFLAGSVALGISIYKRALTIDLLFLTIHICYMTPAQREELDAAFDVVFENMGQA
jgi:hypothetical protein